MSYHRFGSSMFTAIVIAFTFAALETFGQVKEEPSFAITLAMARHVTAGEISGAVAAFYQEGHPPYGAVAGWANIQSNQTIHLDTLFGVMSMTKPITAVALMILVDEGKLSLDDPVAKYIPAFADAKTKSGEPVRGLTVHHVLTHTSGLTGEQGCRVSLEATANELAARPFAFQPGEKWEYGPSLNVAGRIIEVVAGQSYDEFLKQRIFAPLRMNDSTFHPTDEQRKRLAQLYELSDDQKSLVPTERVLGIGQPDCVPNPSGGLFSTAFDMLKFYQMVLNDGELNDTRILSSDAVREMTRVQTGELATGFTPGNGWGLGWCVVRKPQGVTGMLSPGSFGHGGYYGTQGWIDPVKKRIFVLMFQRAGLPNSDASDVRREFQQLAVEALENGP
jgi:CubicO group peptidase (beta-lactamase class C family)